MYNLFFNVIQFQGITKKLQSDFYKNIFLLYTIKKKNKTHLLKLYKFFLILKYLYSIIMYHYCDKKLIDKYL